ncbi:6105_t:CDS:2 [Funneliformis geosporum]|nr:6105_t:CDS:2 [Funneliformis geosporum]
MEKSNRDKFHSKTNNFKEQKMEKLSSFDPERPKKSNRSHHKKKPDLEREKQKAEFERSEKELKKLLVQFGSKARVADDIDRDSSKIRDNIYKLMEKTKTKSLSNNAKAKQDLTPQHHQQQQAEETTTTFKTLPAIFFSIIWNKFLSFFEMIIQPLQSIYQSYEKVYCRINCVFLLIIILIFELSIIGLILNIKYKKYHFEPYEAIVHGTFGVEPNYWSYLTTIFDTVVDFLGEVKHGGRGFGSPSYDGLVPI